jgi:hypothetical protein
VGAIFLRHGSTFIAMREQEYEAEDVLQALIAEHPEVLADDDVGERSNWLPVKRETPVQSWSLDHLFLDREGVPTLVEVKRSSNTQLRREVVAQMLDYAANAATHWILDSLRTWFEAECERREVDPDETLQDAFGVSDGDAYWQKVKTNLDAERIRLVFVADEIPAELRSIVEFLNRQMSATEVFAIEVKQYVDSEGERRTIVPRVIGRTEESKAVKTGARGPSGRWDKQSVREEIERTAGGDYCLASFPPFRQPAIVVTVVSSGPEADIVCGLAAGGGHRLCLSRHGADRLFPRGVHSRRPARDPRAPVRPRCGSRAPSRLDERVTYPKPEADRFDRGVLRPPVYIGLTQNQRLRPTEQGPGAGLNLSRGQRFPAHRSGPAAGIAGQPILRPLYATRRNRTCLDRSCTDRSGVGGWIGGALGSARRRPQRRARMGSRGG